LILMNVRNDEPRSAERQLEEKNQIIAALTVQLEKTAEQLDRLRRNGGDRPGGGSHGDVVRVSPEWTTRLESALNEWSELEPGNRLQSIETGIERILELLESRPLNSPAAPADELLQTEAAKPASEAPQPAAAI